MYFPRPRAARRAPFVLGLLVLFLAGCATARKSEVGDLLWPPPPLTPRIKFVRTLRSEDDLKQSSARQILEALAGKKRREGLFQQPMALAPTPDGRRLYVSDYMSRRVVVFDFEENEAWFLDSVLHPVRRPFGIAVDGEENVYVADSEGKRVRVFTREGKFLRDITSENLERPAGIAINTERRRLYVADASSKESLNHVVHVFGLDGSYLEAFGGRGIKEGKLFFPTYLALDKEGNVYVTDTMNGRVQAFDPEGNYLKSFGQRGDTIGMFDRPKGVALDTFGNVYVVDSTWSNVQIFNQKQQILLYFAGRGRIPGLLWNPTAIAIDNENRIYIADAFNARVALYQLINTSAEDSYLSPPSENSNNSKMGKEVVEESK